MILLTSGGDGLGVIIMVEIKAMTARAVLFFSLDLLRLAVHPP
jgi:hypothetical protein